MDIDVLLARLEALIISKPGRAFFGAPATDADIAAAEEAIGRPLPASYKRFLSVHDGGFIYHEVVAPGSPFDYDTAAWNSDLLLACEDIVRQYEEEKSLAESVEGKMLDWPYVPFFHTIGQELLVFGSPDPTGTQPVIDAFHEYGPDDWDVLSPDFENFLSDYIHSGGSPKVISGAI